jgi:tetratricopeptide (TPR) repeat protein
MKYLSLALVCLVGVAVADHKPNAEKLPPVLFDGLGSHHHPVSTKNAEAQRFFDQGLTFIYAFNHDEAARSFRRAAELDPQLAMAYWGVALAVGPNYNLPADPEQRKEAYDAVQKALKLAPQASEAEQAYVAALAKRYSDDPKADLAKLAVAYKEAMGELAKRYPDDLDAATLYAESAMNLRPWELWTVDGKPQEGTLEIVATLESVLRRNPNHPGANHYYIHAVEASPHPEWALPCAERLKTLAPATGHLVHMPAHVYMRVGDYAEAARANEKAVAADQAYIKSRKVTGVYAMMYYSHNIHFLAVARAFEGRHADAVTAADQLAAHVGPHVKDMPMLEGFLATPTLVRARARRWDELLKAPAPAEGLNITRSMWHFGRGLAHAAAGRADEAAKERKAFLEAKKAVPADAMYSDRNKAQSVLTVAEALLAARVALARQDRRAAVELLRSAVEAEDLLKFVEPPDWYLPVRETLGAVLLAGGEHAEAEKVFRADLVKNPRNGRSLLGLRECLKAQGKGRAAQWIDAEFRAAWKNADTEIRVEDL